MSLIPEKPPRQSLLNRSSPQAGPSGAAPKLLSAHLLFSVEKRRKSVYANHHTQGSQVLVEGSDEDERELKGRFQSWAEIKIVFLSLY